jgi:DNA-binding SARP family transcriptional activator
MWRLTTLGGLSIEQVERTEQGEKHAHLTGSTAQRRPLALLAVLAASGERGVCRDDLLLYFWPDSDVERARNALRQTLFRLRRDLGPADPVVGSNSLSLDPGVVTSDLAEFEGALTGGQLEHAVALYSAPFLQGLSLGSTPEFDEWVVAQRTRLAQRFAAAVESLAHTAEARGDLAAALSWWRRLAAVDPANSRVALGLMTTLAATGDHQGALQYYRLHELLLQEELGVGADDTVVALAERLRNGDGTAAQREDGQATAPRAGLSKPVERSRPAMSLLVPRSFGAIALAAVALPVVVAIGRASLGRSGDRTGPSASPNVIAVLPFVARGDSSSQLGATISDLLSTAIDGAGGLRAADRHAVEHRADSARDASRDPTEAQAVAAQVGAGLVVLGEATASGPQLSLTATLYAPGSPPARLADFAVAGGRNEIAATTDRLAIQVLAKSYAGHAARLVQSASLTTRSLAAFRAYLDGERSFQVGDFAPAMEAFRRAVTEDTTFALAYYRLSIAADWASHPTWPSEALGDALRLMDRVSEHDRQLIRALAAWRRGRGAEALQLYRTVVSQYPDDVEAWYQLGEVLFHNGPAYGHSVLEARPAFERALEFQPGARESLVHLVRLAAKSGDQRAVDTLTQRVIALDSAKDVVEMRLFRAIAADDDEGMRRVIESLRASPDEAVLTAAWRAGTFAEALERAADIASLMVDPSRGAAYQATGRWYVASLALARGKWRLARATIAPALPAPMPNGNPDPGHATALRHAGPLQGGSIDAVHAGQLGLMAALPVLPLSSEELALIRQRVAAWPPAPPALAYWPNLFEPTMRDYVLGLLSVRAGDTSAALRYAARLERLKGDGVTETAHGGALTLRAEVARSAGQREKALALLDAAPPDGSLSSVLPSRAYERFLRAELLRELGRDDDALRWYATQGQSFVPDLIYLAPAHLRQAQVHDRRGDSARAVAHYRRFVELWQEADPELQPMVAAARHRIASLGGEPSGR